MDDPPLTNEITKAQDRFVLEWGRMSSSWGINRTMAQIHAFLLCSGKPHTVEDIMDRLHISRGNASMNLRHLIDWGIVRRFRHPGDRKDIYIGDSDVLQMFARVVRERKRRELDPTIAALHECISMVPKEDESPEAVELRTRLNELLNVFAVIDRIYAEVFDSNETFRQAMELLSSPDPMTGTKHGG